MITKLIMSTEKWPAGTPVIFLDWAEGDAVYVQFPDESNSAVEAARVEAMHEPEETLGVLSDEFGIDQNTLYKAAYDGRLVARKSGSTWLSTRTAVKYAIRKGRIRE